MRLRKPSRWSVYYIIGSTKSKLGLGEQRIKVDRNYLEGGRTPSISFLTEARKVRAIRHPVRHGNNQDGKHASRV
jgi:hypothetical protein